MEIVDLFLFSFFFFCTETLPLHDLTILVLHFWCSDEVEKVAETVEDVAEIVEDVAEAVEKISSDVADSLPENGVLKDAALWIEHASKEVAEDAKQTLDFIHKVLSPF